ncbi:MAG: hypothetical protein HGA45_10405 [Chloroflexales bacterium]|nr:hypothetical protein [Chloroflexales bacterium]
MSATTTATNPPVVATVFALLKLLASLPIEGIALNDQEKLRTAHTAIQILAHCDTAHPEALSKQLASVQSIVRPLAEQAQTEAKRLRKLLAKQSADGALDEAVESSEHVYRHRAKALTALDSALGYGYIALQVSLTDGSSTGVLSTKAVDEAGAKALIAFSHAAAAE